MLANLETTIHKVIRARDVAATPPFLGIVRNGPTSVVIRYASARRLCALARGLVAGLANHYGEQVAVTETGRLKLPDGLYTGIWWYARFPNHYAGEGAVASRELGEFEMKSWIGHIVQSIRAVKADQESLRLQNEFFERSKHPLDTPQ